MSLKNVQIKLLCFCKKNTAVLHYLINPHFERIILMNDSMTKWISRLDESFE